MILPLLSLLAACRSADAPAMPAPAGPSVLLITLDTTRADRLGCYGHASAETPTWDALASEGTLFRRAYASAALTIPSHSTIFTGRAPPAHGVRDNGDFVLGDDAVTLAERFRDAGWTTAAFTAAFPTQRRWGFAQGFDVYHDHLERTPTALDWSDQRRADEVVDDALATLPTLGDDALFVWVHLFDAHWPYEPPEPWASRHEDPYDGEIAYADAQAARLIAWFEANRPGSVMVVTADHGEGLGDGGEQTHGFLLHDGTIHVPLILRGPGIEAGRVVDDPVGSIDIAPTLLALAGLPPHDGLQGRDLRAGGSARIYSEALTGQYNLGLAPLFASTDEAGRYTEGGFGAFYVASDGRIAVVPAPPPEDGGPTLEPHAEALARFRDELGEQVAPTASLDAASLEMLSALGYVGGDPSLAAGEIDPRDAIDVIPLTWRTRQRIGAGRLGEAQRMLDVLRERMPDTFGVQLIEAQLLHRRGDLPEAVEVLGDLFLRSPTSTVALQLADIHATVGDWREAERWYREALDLHAVSPEAMTGIVRSVRVQGRAEEAEALATEFLGVYPDLVELSLVRAELFLAWGRVDEAVREADRALELLPWSPWSHALAGEAHWARGEPDEAIERFRDALSLAPYHVPLRARLAYCLLEVGRNAEGLRVVNPLVAQFPEDPAIARLHATAQQAVDNERAGIRVTPLPPDLLGADPR